MKKIFQLAIITVMASMLSACESLPFHNAPIWQYSMFERPPGDHQYPPLYVNGWQHGCESGAETSANLLFRFKYKFKQDWQQVQNYEYATGWENGFNHCRKYVLQHNMQSINNVL